MESKTDIIKAMEMESAVKSLGMEHFAENATYLGIKATSIGPTTVETILSSCEVLEMSYGFYQVTGVGPTEQTSMHARMDCMMKINALMAQQLGFAQAYRHSLPVENEDKDHLLDDIKAVLDLVKFSRKQMKSNLKLLHHFVAEDPTSADSPMKRLQLTTKILGGLVGYTSLLRNGVYVTKCMFIGYNSTGLGLTIKESKAHAASEMLYLLKQIAGLRFVKKQNGRPCLHLPAVDCLKVKMLSYFLVMPNECISLEDRLRELESMVDDEIQCRVIHSEVVYTLDACNVSVTGTDELSCNRQCQIEILLKLHKWCGFNLVTDYETVEKYYKNVNESCPRLDERREKTTRQNERLKTAKNVPIEGKPENNVEVTGRTRDAKPLLEKIMELSSKLTNDVTVFENDNVFVSNFDDDKTDSSTQLAKHLAKPKRNSRVLRLPSTATTFRNNVAAENAGVRNPYSGNVISRLRRPDINGSGSTTVLTPFENDSRRQVAATNTSRIQQVSTSKEQCHDDLQTERDFQIRDDTQRQYSFKKINRKMSANGQRDYESSCKPSGYHSQGQGRNVIHEDFNVPSTFKRSDVYGQKSFNNTNPFKVVENDQYDQRDYKNSYKPSESEFNVQGQNQNVVQKDYNVSPTVKQSDVYGQNSFNTTNPFIVVENDQYGQRDDENTYSPSENGIHGQEQDQNVIQEDYNVPATTDRLDVHGQNSFNTTNPVQVVENDYYGQRYNENTYIPSESEFHVQGQGQNTNSTTNPSYYVVESGYYMLFFQ